MLKLLIATNNQGKLAEFQALLASYPFELVTPAAIGLDLDVPEHGHTYAENAILKAAAFSRASRLACLADDSGLEVAALGGQPGLHSRRFGPGPAATDAARRAYLLGRIQDHPRPWIARFICVVAITLAPGEIHTAEGICPGEIIPQERGEGGFGYDPIFLLSDPRTTMAELTMEEKNRLSHRARAVQAAHPLFLQLARTG